MTQGFTSPDREISRLSVTLPPWEGSKLTPVLGRLIISHTVSLIPKKNRRAARGGSARTNALAINLDTLVSNALNKEQQKRPKNRRKKNSLKLHAGQPSNSVGTHFFSVSPGSTPGGVRVKGRELVREVNYNPAGTYSSQTLPLHPSSLPRLASYSAIYEMYIFHQARAIFQSSMPTTQGGLTALAIDYDVTDPSANSMMNMMRNISSSMSNVYADNSCLIDKRLSRLPKYLTNPPGTTGTLDTSQAKILSATEGVVVDHEGTGKCGYLLIEYDVEFFTPQ